MTVVRGIKVEENTEYIWIWNQEDAIRVSTNIYIYIFKMAKVYGADKVLFVFIDLF